MRKRTFIAGLVLAGGCAAGLTVFAQAPLPSRWMDPSGLPRPAHEPPPAIGPAKVALLGPRRPGLSVEQGAAGRVCLVVHSNVYASISNKLDRFQADLERENYTVVSFAYESGGASAVRETLSNLYHQVESLAGALLIGDIPYIVFELTQNWGSGNEYEDFPCDLYFMDLNGVWEDNTNTGSFGAGKYDTHSGNTDMEIWTSRMKPDRMTALGSEVFLFNNYFDKNHAYRTHELVPHRRALAYVDDDWAYDTSEDTRNLSWTYGEIHVASRRDPEATAGPDYRNSHMTSDYELMHTRSHGSSTSHGYYTNSRANFNSVNSGDYRQRTPTALFYSFFVCSGCDFTINNNLGGTAAFNTNNSGLLAWGSTKTGGMWDDELLYEQAALGVSIGESFRQWFNDVQSWYSGSTVKPWWYGMVLLGDGSLCFSRPDPGLTSFARGGDCLTSRWAAVQATPYCLQRAGDLVSPQWSNVDNIVTSIDWTLTCTDTNPPAGFHIYRVAEDCSRPSNLLRNASFELPGTTSEQVARHWQWNVPDQHGSTWDNVARELWRAKSGTWEATVHGTWSGAGSGGWWQEAVANPGQTYEASAWFYADVTPPYGPWTSAVQELKIEFFSPSFGTALSVVTQRLTGVGETWTWHSVTGTAPGATAWARFVVAVNGAGSSGALQFDDARLARVP